jgi:hypothetical protein
MCVCVCILLPSRSLSLSQSSLYFPLLSYSLLFFSPLYRIVRIRGIVMDSRGLPFGHPVAPNRIIANCLLAGTALRLHACFFLFFSPYIYQPFCSSHTLLTTHTHFSPLTHSSHHFLGTSPVHRDSTVHDLRHYTHGIQGTARRRALTTNGIVTSNRESVNLSSSARSTFNILWHHMTI